MADRNREAWLTDLALAVRVVFKGYNLDKFRVTCGWPSRNALGARSRTVGQCFAPECSRDGTIELFVSPLIDDPAEVAGVLTHELAHAVAGVKAGHGKKYQAVCKAVGLTAGEPRQAMPGPHLAAFLAEHTKGLGVYPHKALVPTTVLRKAGGGSVGLVCSEGCGMKVTVSKKLLEAHGPPTCSCGGKLVAPDEDEGEGD